MAQKKLGVQTYATPTKPRIASWATIAGKKEGEGPLGSYFDRVIKDDLMGLESWEKAESRMLFDAVTLAIQKGNLQPSAMDVFFGGDLLNQIVSANYAARELAIPFLGQYGACSTMAQSLLLSSLLIDGGFVNRAIAATCSHFATAERQYRMPLELGTQRAPSAQWTVTGAGAAVVTCDILSSNIAVESVTIGRVRDLGVSDATNMGAAMAPAAADTLLAHLSDTGRSFEYYDLIVTGDLGIIGKDLTMQLCQKQNVGLDGRYIDCGCEVFSQEQDVHAGGSGCGCSAITLCGWLLSRMQRGEIRRMLFIATGALMSPTTSLQGESIPGIAHAVSLEVI